MRSPKVVVATAASIVRQGYSPRRRSVDWLRPRRARARRSAALGALAAGRAGIARRRVARPRGPARARRGLGAAETLDRPVPRRRRRHDNALAAYGEIHVTVRARRARVRGRAERAQQPQLLERGLELGTEDAPLDPSDRGERGLDRRALAFRAEVRTQPRAQIAGATHVEHLVVRVTEEVNTGKRRRAECERALR